MKAGVASAKGVVVADVPQPRPKPNEVLVKVKAAALNRADLTTGSGLPHGPGGGIGQPIGIEWAGEVIETGADVKDIWPGERVMCSGNGGYAEFAVSDWGRVIPDPGRHEFRGCGDAAGLAHHAAQRVDHGRPHAAGRQRADPGCKFRRRA